MTSPYVNGNIENDPHYDPKEECLIFSPKELYFWIGFGDEDMSEDDGDEQMVFVCPKEYFDKHQMWYEEFGIAGDPLVLSSENEFEIPEVENPHQWLEDQGFTYNPAISPLE